MCPMPRRPALLFLLALFPALCAAAPWRADERNSYGWQFMTPAERVEHQRRLRRFETYEACKAYQAEHHALMAQRARKAGVVLEPKAQSGCDQLRAHGRLR